MTKSIYSSGAVVLSPVKSNSAKRMNEITPGPGTYK